MPHDHHTLNWYDDEVRRLRDIVRERYGVELDWREMKLVRDEMYRAVNSAKVRSAREREAIAEAATGTDQRATEPIP